VPIPHLNSHGYLPGGIHDADLDEIGRTYATTIHRSNLFGGLLRFTAYIKGFGCVRFIYVDGSFVTDKPVPGDVDAVIELPQFPGALSGMMNQILNEKRSKDLYHVHPFTVLHSTQGGYVDFFQRLRTQEAASKKLPPGFRKGILRVTL
jgi:hypothetical protein